MWGFQKGSQGHFACLLSKDKLFVVQSLLIERTSGNLQTGGVIEALRLAIARWGLSS